MFVLTGGLSLQTKNLPLANVNRLLLKNTHCQTHFGWTLMAIPLIILVSVFMGNDSTANGITGLKDKDVDIILVTLLGIKFWYDLIKYLIFLPKQWD